MTDYIHIAPNISKDHASKMNKYRDIYGNVDNDAEQVLKTPDININSIRHEPTREEELSEQKIVRFPWLLILFAIIIIVLIAAVIWLVLKHNESKNREVPPELVQYLQSQQCPQYPSQYPSQYPPQVQTPQMAASQATTNEPKNEPEKGSLKELLETREKLKESKLENIEEEESETNKQLCESIINSDD